MGIDQVSQSSYRSADEDKSPIDAARDYILITGTGNWFSYYMKFAINGFELYFGHPLKTNPRLVLTKFELQDQARKALYHGVWKEWTNIHQITSSTDPSDYFYTEISWRKTVVALGNYHAQVDLLAKNSELNLFGEKIIIRYRGRSLAASVPRSILAKLPLGKIVTILYILWTGREFAVSGPD